MYLAESAHSVLLSHEPFDTTLTCPGLTPAPLRWAFARTTVSSAVAIDRYSW
jgi:hypothetical protein